MARNRKNYDRIFKEKAVLLSYQTKNIPQLEKELHISRSLLYTWRKEYQKFGAGSFPGCGKLRMLPEEKKIYELEKKLKNSELNLEILKKGSKYLRQGKVMSFKFIENHENIYAITKMCKSLGISEMTYRRWKKQPITETQRQRNLVKEQIKIIYFKSKQHFGSQKISKELQKNGLYVSKALVFFYMKQLGLYRKSKRKYKVTTDSKHNLCTAPNVLNRSFSVNEPSKVWVSDITYLQINKRFLYLTIIMDLFDRKIIGWNLGNRLTAKETSIAAWEMAVKNRNVTNKLIFHSDRGVQYANNTFTSILDSYQCTRSMSRKANSCDNAVSESFFSTLKRELIYQNNLLTEKQMKIEITDYIENWYNKKRRHSALHYMTIDEFTALKGL